jgi:amino acid transporter
VILLLAVIAGILAGIARAGIKKRKYQPIRLRHTWLVVVAFLPQYLAFFLPATRTLVPTWLATLFLILSLSLMLVFILLNLSTNRLGFLTLGLGLVLNLLVIMTNGGLMPISPENAVRLAPQIPAETWQSGNRFGKTKDVILRTEETRFSFLSDRFISPDWLHYRFVFSLGDILIAIGIFWVLFEPEGGDLVVDHSKEMKNLINKPGS